MGIGTDNLINVKTDDYGRMLAKDLEEKIILSINQNKRPFYVNATAGTTVMGAFDDFHSIADICFKYKLWMHVDVRIFNFPFLVKLLITQFPGLSWWKHNIVSKAQAPIVWHRTVRFNILESS